MTFAVSALFLFLIAGILSAISSRLHRFSCLIGAIGAVCGSVLTSISSLLTLTEDARESLNLSWSIPGGALSIGIDPLSAFFLLPIAFLGTATAIYGVSYLRPYRGQKALGMHWLFFNSLIGSMVLVVLARNAILFLVAWEVMALASYLLITLEDENEEVRRAGLTYLFSTHLGTAFLILLFAMIGGIEGSFDFNRWSIARPAEGGLFLIIALIGFGTKAGIIPLHVWLPEAHPAAPSHVSALMSGAMIKTGIYGLIRTLLFLGNPEPWWGWMLILLGLGTGIIGVIYALSQSDLKRLLAYSSIENIGIIVSGIGIGILGISTGMGSISVLGFFGGMIHVLNHAVFKGLLFLGAGSVLHLTGTRDIDRLGGLLRSMPWTGLTFLIGSLAIAALPPLNGFIGEFLIYLGALKGVTNGTVSVALPVIAVIVSLGLIGGLSAVCFTKAFGIVFLGKGRARKPYAHHGENRMMSIPMAFLASLCVTIGIFPLPFINTLATAIKEISGLQAQTITAEALPSLSAISYASMGFILLIVFTLLIRWLIFRGRDVREDTTWDCGYIRPSERMQYTGSGFTQPLTDLFRHIIGAGGDEVSPSGLFPHYARFSTLIPDVFKRMIFEPVFCALNDTASRLARLQYGKTHLFVMYVVLTLLTLLFWGLTSK